MRRACELLAILALASCGARTPAPPVPATAPDAAPPNAAPALRDESPAPPETDPVPMLAPPR